MYTIFFTRRTFARSTLLAHCVSGVSHARCLCNCARSAASLSCVKGARRALLFVLVHVAIITTRTRWLRAPIKKHSPASIECSRFPRYSRFPRVFHDTLPVSLSASPLLCVVTRLCSAFVSVPRPLLCVRFLSASSLPLARRLRLQHLYYFYTSAYNA